ncbi:MFS transporter [Nocardioides sp. W7]|uniref:MFS transporter n=1 Tax=Nocardioides sp. W7 TaxID=2931390 RepID=UPI001FD38BE8|nr:MFS transporter [Nocardioides sp. W7]
MRSSRATNPQMRRILLSSYLGSTIEFYDFLLYGLAASLVFNEVFFTGLDPVVGTIASFGTLAVGYLARPLGGIVFGHFGDRVGRKSMLVITMTLMGAASCVIGMLPTTAQVGALAPVLLVVLRVVQGVAVGGEWGGAALMALEHSDKERRGFSSSVTNMGGPSGAVLATAIFGLLSLMPESAFMAWGWRIPFLLSAVLVGVGLFIRLKITESPLFVAAREQAEAGAAAAPAKPPILVVLTRFRREVVLSAGGGLAAFTVQSLLATFCIAYAMDAGHSRSAVLAVGAATSLVHVFTIPAFAVLSDRVGRRPVMLGGVAATVVLIHPVLLMIGEGSLGLLFVGYLIANPILQASMYGPLAAYTTEMFGTRSRYTGASLGYQLSTTLGAGFAPIIGASLLASAGDNDPTYVSLFVAGVAVLSGLAIWRAAESRDRDLDSDDAQAGRVEATARPEAVAVRA